MPSPFPGMDPYLEDHWRDVHHRLITYMSDALQERLPADLRARVEERVVLETPEGLGSQLFPDVRVVESRPQPGGDLPHSAGVAVAEPLVVKAEPRSLTEGFIEIIDVGSGNRVVTVVEVLSPTNKTAGDGLTEYQNKQRDLCRSDTNLVEIDLLRRGRHVLAVPLMNLPHGRRSLYMVCIRRSTQRAEAEVYLIHLNQRLPTVKIPLRSTDADVPLNLQLLIEQCYRKGRYEGDLDYRQELEPPLMEPDATWVDDLLRGHGHRPAAPPKKSKRKPRRKDDV